VFVVKAKKSDMLKKTTKQSKARAAAKNGSAKPRTREPAGLDGTITVNRRAATDRRKGADRREQEVPVAVERRKLERRQKVNRRRQIDPTTCERSYSDEEIEFMTALDDYKRTSGRMFPTCSEILEVVRGLGYEKRPASPPTSEPATDGGFSIPAGATSAPAEDSANHHEVCAATESSA
jgi:hypothetical protein